MAIDTYGHYTGTSLVPQGRGETTPSVELCESVVPHIGKGFIPAPYLPIKRYDKWIESGVVISVGTAVGFDNSGYLVPAGLVGGTSTFTYTSYDTDLGVLAADNGLAATAETVTIPTGLMPTGGVIPVGVAAYNIYQHLGGVTFTSWPTYSVDNSNPYTHRLHNTTKEDLVAFTCDYVIEVPWIGTTEPTGLSTAALSYAHAYGTFTYGGFVKVDSKGMFIPSTTRSDNLFVGQVLGFKTYPVDSLNRVKTAYEGNSNKAWNMPGSATKGIPRHIHLATDGAYAGGNTAAGNCTSIIINIQL